MMLEEPETVLLKNVISKELKEILPETLGYLDVPTDYTNNHYEITDKGFNLYPSNKHSKIEYESSTKELNYTVFFTHSNHLTSESKADKLNVTTYDKNGELIGISN